MTSTYIDGDLFAADAGALRPLRRRQERGLGRPRRPRTALLRPAPSYSLIAAGPARREGQIYAYDSRTRGSWRIDQVDGKYVAQYRLAGGAPDWDDLRAMYVVPGVDDEPVDARLDVARRRPPGHPRRRPGRRAGGKPQHVAAARPASAEATPKPTKKP